LLDWDSEFWGVRIGRVTEDAPDFDAVDAWASEHKVACLYFLCRDEPGAAVRAEEAGFRLTDVRVELGRSAADEPSSVRPARSEDEAPLRGMARANHRITRFYADPNFPDERCDDLYETWIARSLEGWADAVLVAESEGRPAGYVSLHDRDGTGSIGLIGVDPDSRGRQLGRDLVLGAVRWCAERGLADVTVVTQGRNVPALRTFESCGFRTTDVGLWFHKWYDV
jgi:dTDP-4-amino-4,6-dideoxy-D-galactose acyltransferase